MVSWLNEVVVYCTASFGIEQTFLRVQFINMIRRSRCICIKGGHRTNLIQSSLKQLLEQSTSMISMEELGSSI